MREMSHFEYDGESFRAQSEIVGGRSRLRVWKIEEGEARPCGGFAWSEDGCEEKHDRLVGYWIDRYNDGVYTLGEECRAHQGWE